MRVCIFGTGYVGLVSGTCLAEVGHDVVCVDVDAAKVEGLEHGVIPGWAEGLQLIPVGSKFKFWIPAQLAYGEQAPPTIGPNQPLVFEVELLEIVKPGAK